MLTGNSQAQYIAISLLQANEERISCCDSIGRFALIQNSKFLRVQSLLRGAKSNMIQSYKDGLGLTAAIADERTWQWSNVRFW